MDPEDLPGLGELDEIDLGEPEPGDESEPLLPPVEPTEPEPTPDPIDLGELDLPDLPDREWGGAPQDPPPAAPDPVDLPDGPAPMDQSDAAAPAPVELDLDLDRGGLDDAVSPSAEPPADVGPAEVDLSLDPDGDDTLLAPDEDAPEPPVLVELPSELTVEPFVVAEANSWLMPSLITAGVVALGISASSFRRRRAAPVDFAAQLDELGIDARVEHLDLTGLEELLEQGRSVLLSTDGTAGVDAAAVVALREVDRRGERVVVADDRGATFVVELDRFEAAWSDSANQVVVAAGADGGVALVPVTLSSGDLAASS